MKHINIKMVVAAVMWTAALATAIGSVAGESRLAVFSILASALAAFLSAMIGLEVVAERTAEHILATIRGERESTAQAGAGVVIAVQKMMVDKLENRLAARQDATLNRLATEISAALSDEAREPTPIR